MVSVSLQAPWLPHDYPIHVERPLEVLDPTLLQVARGIYGRYCHLCDSKTRKNPEAEVQRPLGVVVNQASLRAVLIFKRQVALLPTEAFVPLDRLETELY
ncbi:hypothetical protein [Roseofilum casamattae]|uniref:Uncharacterized protein n=1 Tax=Roseofilum casamattae BLCC-M143 TaxID=3022442 RepID=A0ABT7C2V0_9CYAN|nr:hypothetical protein [Roseofilum casamattae]MDJ1185001.1 hypothetical protein [Roseofilum casamattae BLCC-M143]